MEFTNFKYLIVLIAAGECLYEGDTCSVGIETGTCKRLQLCQPIHDEVIKAGSPMPTHVRRKLISLSCGFDGDDPLICCVEPVTIPTASPNSLDNKQGNVNDYKGGPVSVENHPNLQLLPNNCGLSSFSDKVLGGVATGLYEMPWMALLAYNTVRGREFHCGGTVISEYYVLTAAHCINYLGSKTLDTVVIGEYDIRMNPDCKETKDAYGTIITECAPDIVNATIASIIAHPGYTPSTLTDDIGLIRLAEPVNFYYDNMKPICLPTTPALQKEQLIGKNGDVAGWGAADNYLQSEVLLHAELPILDNKECQKAYKISPLKDAQLCAGGLSNKDSCAGDSGGPIMVAGETRYGKRTVQRGIVSYGSKRCGVSGNPGIYTNVAYYMDWILDNISE